MKKKPKFVIKSMDCWNLNKLFEFSSEKGNQSLYQIQNIVSNSNNEREIFNLNLYAILTKYTECIDRGQIIEAIKFLEHHHKFTSKKKLYLRFVKHYIITKSWMSEEAKKKHTLNDNEILKWVHKKEKRTKKIILYISVFLFIIALSFMAITNLEYRNLIIGAFIGSFVTIITRLYEQLLE